MPTDQQVFCPRDTNGDGDCGNRLCSYCGIKDPPAQWLLFNCPACSETEVYLTNGGYLRCLAKGCPRPLAASEVFLDGLNHQQHIITLREDGWSSTHPLIERVTGEIHDCQVVEHAVRYAQDMEIPSGRYVVSAIPRILGVQEPDWDFQFADDEMEA